MTRRPTLDQDARNRALRSFLTGLGVDVLVAVTLVLVTAFAGADGWGSIQWTILGFSLVKSIVQAVGAFILRRFVDGSRLPTPLPPDPVPEPADDVETGHGR